MTKPKRPPFRRRIRPNFVYSIISVAMVLIITGLFGLVILHGQSLIRQFKEQVNVMIELKPDVDQDGIDAVGLFLAEQEWAKKSSVEFISKDEALEELQEEFEYIMQMELPNPLFHVYEFNVNAEYLQPDSLMAIRSALLDLPVVQDVYYQQGIVDGLSRNIKDLSLFAIAISTVLLIIATTLIFNTNKLSLYSNRFIIKNMQLAGASWAHISKPFLQRSVYHGLISAVLAAVVLGSGLVFLHRSLPETRDILGSTQLFFVFFALSITGILINFTSTYYTVSRFLSMRTDDLY